MKRAHSFYDAATGRLTGRTFSSSVADEKRHLAALEANTSAGCGSVEGEYDHLTSQVDLSGAAPAVVPRTLPLSDEETALLVRRRRSAR